MMVDNEIWNKNRDQILKREQNRDHQQIKIDEMYRVKNQIFTYIHQRIRTLKKSHTSQKLGWYKRRWGLEIKQFYFDSDPSLKNEDRIKGDLDKIIKKLKLEYEDIKSLSNKDFKSKFSHKRVKYKQRIKDEMRKEKNGYYDGGLGRFYSGVVKEK